MEISDEERLHPGVVWAEVSADVDPIFLQIVKHSMLERGHRCFAFEVEANKDLAGFTFRSLNAEPVFELRALRNLKRVNRLFVGIRNLKRPVDVFDEALNEVGKNRGNRDC